jgi:hypothetical protein
VLRGAQPHFLTIPSISYPSKCQFYQMFTGLTRPKPGLMSSRRHAGCDTSEDDSSIPPGLPQLFPGIMYRRSAPSEPSKETIILQTDTHGAPDPLPSLWSRRRAYVFNLPGPPWESRELDCCYHPCLPYQYSLHPWAQEYSHLCSSMIRCNRWHTDAQRLFCHKDSNSRNWFCNPGC